ncbi:MAG: carboxypeptidase regulatory-like domain-containing protein [Acidobacteria bacterium]|nr:carboxypeptidase regulatory-like domain-containing protein [Acidobacteriota bacterium]
MSVRLNSRAALLASAAVLAVSFTWVHAQQRSGATVALDADDIGGVVTSAKGPEAGVWVIAETTDLPTKFAKMVVTDDTGRYVLPDLPRASYEVFVRGYGLVDSPRVRTGLGQRLDLKAVVAPDGRAAAQVYPANYWLSLLEIPKGEHAAKDVVLETRACFSCHQVGTRATRELTKGVGPYASTLEAWDRHVTMGPNGANMGAVFGRLGAQRKAFADWTDRIAAGAYPEAPPRPVGVERNLVISMWDWARPTSRRSDAAGTDERSPTLNANGLIYGAIQTSDILAVLDPRANATSEIAIPSGGPVLDANTPRSPAWGDEKIWKRQADPRSVAMDAKGRVWVTARTRAPQQQPAFCKDGAASKYAKYFPLPGPSARQIEVYDPTSKQFTAIDSCFAADHNQFDDHDALVFGQENAIGWIDTVAFDKTHDGAASQAWCPGVVDTNGDGRISTGWTEPDQSIDPTKDHRIEFGCYSIGISPTDGSIWCSGIEHEDKTLVRLERGSNPPMSCKAEVYVPPPSAIPLPYSGGVAIDSDGVVWQNWRGVHKIFSFDRRKCKVLNGPTATGQQCPEGWTEYTKPGPTFKGEPGLSTDMLYLTNIDHHDALGLGKDVLVAGDFNADSFFVVMPQNGQMKTLTLRVPYPLGFSARHAAGRIDDPKAGWKGRGLWSSYSMYTPWHQEGGKGTRPKVVKFQMRPNPLAK